MTQSTEQERAEFEAQFKVPVGVTWDCGMYLVEHKHQGSYRVERFLGQWEGWQAARRAPVVLHGWKLVPEKATFGMLDAMHEICGVNGKPWPGLVDAASRKYAAMLAAAPQPACNPSMQPTQELRDKAEHEALREVYENARGVLRYDGIDAARLQSYMQGLSNAVEDVKLIDSGLWEPEVAQEGGK